jgi:hypothetical protein
MVNLPNVTHTCVCGTPKEKVASITASMMKTNTDASIDVEGLLFGHRNYKTSYDKISK